VKIAVCEIIFKTFLKEKNEQGKYVHKRLLSALKSLKVNLPYLYTYKNSPLLNIPHTTNSCDGYFSHLKLKI
jgi:hypothetical protein